MKLLSLLAALAMACPAENRDKMLEAILATEAGTVIQLRLTDGTRMSGRLQDVDATALRLQVAGGGAILMREVPFGRIRAFRARRSDGSFAREFKRSAARAAAFSAVYWGAILILMAVSGG